MIRSNNLNFVSNLTIFPSVRHTEAVERYIFVHGLHYSPSLPTEVDGSLSASLLARKAVSVLTLM